MFKDGLSLPTRVKAKSLAIAVDDLCLWGLAADWFDEGCHECQYVTCTDKKWQTEKVVAESCGALCLGLPQATEGVWSEGAHWHPSPLPCLLCFPFSLKRL